MEIGILLWMGNTESFSTKMIAWTNMGWSEDVQLLLFFNNWGKFRWWKKFRSFIIVIIIIHNNNSSFKQKSITIIIIVIFILHYRATVPAPLITMIQEMNNVSSSILNVRPS